MRDSDQRSSTNCKCQVRKGILDLPREIIYDILCRLPNPTESILICGVVCKTWYAITQDPCFINKLGDSHYLPTRLILRPLSVKDISYTPNYLVLVDIENHKARQIPLEKMFRELKITCSCNGFLCMAPEQKLDPVVIYNPITRDHLILPPSDSKSSVLSQEIGLGFDPSTNKYKVVRGYTGLSYRDTMRRFEIISLGEISWRELSTPQFMVVRVGWEVIFLSGALYWTKTEGVNTIVVQLNLSDEKFRNISFPEYYPLSHVSLGLIEIKGIVILVLGSSTAIRFWRIGKGKGEDELSFFLHTCYDTCVRWGGGVSCAFVCQMNDESYLLQVGCRNSQKERRVHLTQYFPDKVKYSNLKLRGLPDCFQTACFKPSLAPVPK
ncbi:hypothetical protein Vadar_034137 [Vaccinium darrowii]|uniref:Uncharacterized protein n=1 Tax=Vaccinium darrowii TaxID=229202 RepID=A0ACB7Z113_9ERIC|nr:hypothetical protein Vadar_034137 [Vaccinium darrowii]